MERSDPKSLCEELLDGRPSAERRHEILLQLDKVGTGPYGFCAMYLYTRSDDPSACWTSQGYFTEISDWSPKLQLFWAAHWACLQISNGGVGQYIYNDGGDTLPEVRLWLELVGDTKSAEVFKKLEYELGENLRSRACRDNWLGHQSEEDLENNYNRFLGPTLDSEEAFESIGRKYLADHCGVTSLLSRPEG